MASISHDCVPNTKNSIEGECPICKSGIAARLECGEDGNICLWYLFHLDNEECPGLDIGPGYSLEDLQREWNKQRAIARRLIIQNWGPR